MHETASRTAALLERSAAALAAGSQAPDEAVAALLSRLEYASGATPGSPERRHRVSLLRAASRFSRIFQMQTSDAPGVYFFGAEMSPAALRTDGREQPKGDTCGAGLSIRTAFESCVGEGIEFLSQFETENDGIRQASLGDGLRGLDAASQDVYACLLRPSAEAGRATFDWVAARRMSDGREVLLPADLCLRRPAGRSGASAPWALGTGCAAGPTFEAAALHGLLELVERDAASLWWQGGIRAGPVAGEAQAEAVSSLARIRGDATDRPSWLLDITSDLGVPCVAAVSCRPDGYRMACGLAARPTLQAAARSALLEMCQMELALAIVDAKRRESGEAGLNQTDRRYVLRSTAIHCPTCELLHPGRPAKEALALAGATPGQTLDRLVGLLASHGLASFALDLTRPELLVPVAKVVAPELQPYPAGIVTPRLAAAITRTGGGERYTHGVVLL